MSFEVCTATMIVLDRAVRLPYVKMAGIFTFSPLKSYAIRQENPHPPLSVPK